MKIVTHDAPEPVDEDRLIERILGGDVDAYGHFVRAYQRRVYGTALRLLRDGGEAECAAQDAFLKAYQALPDFRGGATFETWITRIVINGCRDRLKRKRIVRYFHQRASEAAESEVGAVDAAPSGDPSPERIVQSREIKATLKAAIDELSPRQRVVFVLKHLEERPIAEIAQLLGLDAGTVKVHLFRAATRIRARLKDFRRSP